MSLDSQIRSVLSREADSVDTPWPPPLEDLRAGGATRARRRWLRTVLVTAVAASLLLVGTTGVLLTQQADPRPDADTSVVESPGARLAELPVGAPPGVLYCLGGMLRWGSESWELTDRTCSWPNRLAQVGDVAVGVDSETAGVSLFDADGRHPLSGRVDAPSSPVVISPDGKLAGWILLDRVDGRQVIVLWDTLDRVEWQRVVAPTSDELNLEGIDASGRVYLTSVREDSNALADQIWVWPSRERGSAFREVTGVGEYVTVVDVLPDGLAILTREDEVEGRGVAVWGSITDEGRFVLEAAGVVREAVWSPGRSRYAASTGSSVSVFSKTGSVEVELPMPVDALLAGEPSWESSEQVLVPVESVSAGADHTAWVLRCAVEEGECEVAASGERGVMLPADSGIQGPSASTG